VDFVRKVGGVGHAAGAPLIDFVHPRVELFVVLAPQVERLALRDDFKAIRFEVGSVDAVDFTEKDERGGLRGRLAMIMGQLK
jgi:hypothetical protein